MKDESFFLLLLIIWYTSNYGVPHNIIHLLIKIYKDLDHFLLYCNHMLNPEYFSFNNLNENESEKDDENKKESEQKPETKYEDKYLNDIRKLDKEFKFDKEQEEVKYAEFWKEINDNCLEKIDLLKKKLSITQEKLLKYEGCDDYCVYNNEEEDSNNNDTDDDNENLGKTKEQIINDLTESKSKLVEEISILQKQTETKEGQHEIVKKAQEQAKEFMLNLRLEKLKNCFIMESTPLGNVLMIYDPIRLTFKYYSDNTIPYRYLETVGRKYVKFFNCRPIFVDMEDELKLAEEKWEKERKEKEEKEKEEKRKMEELKANNKVNENKKSVFAKFKSYNKDSVTGKSIMAPPKNNIQNKQLTKEQENEKILLKDKANRYTYEGKISNFSFLKKIERKVVDKKYAMTFADFKKIQQIKNKK